MNSAPCLDAHADKAGRKPVGRHDEAALALDRLDEHRGDVVGADLLVDQVERLRGRLRRRSSPPSRSG